MTHRRRRQSAAVDSVPEVGTAVAPKPVAGGGQTPSGRAHETSTASDDAAGGGQTPSGRLCVGQWLREVVVMDDREPLGAAGERDVERSQPVFLSADDLARLDDHDRV